MLRHIRNRIRYMTIWEKAATVILVLFLLLLLIINIAIISFSGFRSILNGGVWNSIYKENPKLIPVITAVTVLSCAAVLFTARKFMHAVIIKPLNMLAEKINDIDYASLDTLDIPDHSSTEIEILVNAIDNMLSRIGEERNSLRKTNKILHYNANYDVLTGLRNLMNCAGILKNEILVARDSMTFIGVYMIGLDNFKFVNSAAGYYTGDKFIISIAQRLTENLGEEAVVGRIGDDRFIVIIGGFNEKRTVHNYADKIVSLFEEPFVISDREKYISASVGSCTYPNDAGNADSLIKNAEIAMRRAKQTGGNQYHRYRNEFKKVLRRELHIGNKIRDAIKAGCSQFEIYFQPKLQTCTGKIISCEAMIRWDTPRGPVMSGELLRLAEESGLILPLSKWALDETCRYGKQLEVQGIDHKISVNISARVVLHGDFLDFVKEAADNNRFDLNKLDIEISGAALTVDSAKTNDILKRLRGLGITVSIGGYGAEYSSLNIIRKLSVDRVNIDRSFITGLENSKGDRSIVNAIVTMANDMGIAAAVKGVERAGQYEYLREFECDEIQGCFISKPLRFDEYIMFCKHWEL